MLEPWRVERTSVHFPTRPREVRPSVWCAAPPRALPHAARWRINVHLNRKMMMTIPLFARAATVTSWPAPRAPRVAMSANSDRAGEPAAPAPLESLAIP